MDLLLNIFIYGTLIGVGFICGCMYAQEDYDKWWKEQEKNEV